MSVPGEYKEVPFKGNAEQCLTDACRYSLINSYSRHFCPAPNLSFTSCQCGAIAAGMLLFPYLQSCSATSLTSAASGQKHFRRATCLRQTQGAVLMLLPPQEKIQFVMNSVGAACSWALQGAWREVLRLQRFLFLSMGSRVDVLTFATIRECGTFHKLRDFKVQCLGQKLVSKSAPWFLTC